MNPGPTLGALAVVAAYTIVLGSLLIFLKLMSNRRRRLEQRLQDLRGK